MAWAVVVPVGAGVACLLGSLLGRAPTFQSGIVALSVLALLAVASLGMASVGFALLPAAACAGAELLLITNSRARAS